MTPNNFKLKPPEEKFYDELEKDFQKRVVRFARDNGWRVYSVPDSRRATLTGYPDLTMYRVEDDRLIFAELKREDGKLRAEQIAVIAELSKISESGAFEVVVWRPSMWEEIVNTLIRTHKKNPK